MKVLATAAGLGVGFGFAISWVHATDPDTIRQMLLLNDLYLFGVLGVSTVTAFVGMRVLRRLGLHALVTREPVGWTLSRPTRQHVVGSAIFGIGWGVANTCPGPVAAQLGQGAFWSMLTIAGIVIGIRVRDRQTSPSVAPEAPARAATR